jgi:signal transduction histidine kinase/ActR/RegA family two-component response regulator
MLPLNFLAFSGILTVLFSTVTAFVVLRSNARSPVHLTLGAFSILVALWGLGISLGFLSADPQAALFWFRFLNETAMLIPIVFVHFVYAFLGKVARRRHLLYLGYAATLIYFAVTSIFYEHFVSGISANTAWFDFYPTAGPLYLPYFFGFLLFVVLGMMELFLARKSAAYQHRTQINYLLCSMSIGFTGGSTTFPLVFGIPLYPFGVLGVTLLNAIFAYALIKHRLLDLSAALIKLSSRLVTHLIIVTLASLIYFSLLDSNRWTLLQFLCFAGLIALGCEAYAWLRNSVSYVGEKLFFKETFDNQTLVNECIERLDQATNLDQLTDDITALLEKVKYRCVSFYRSSQLSGKPLEQSQSPFFDVLKRKEFDVALNSELLALLRKTRHPLRHDEDRKLTPCFDSHNATVCVPLIAGTQLYGFIFACKIAENKKGPSVGEMAFFDLLARQAGMALFRLHAYSKEQKMLEALHQQREQSLKSLASSIAHEMRNPLSQASMGLDSIGNLLPASGAQISAEQASRLSRFVSLGKSAINRGHQMIAMILGSMKSNTVDQSQFEYLSAAKATQKAVDEYSFNEFGTRDARDSLRDRVSVHVVRDFVFYGNETAYVFVLFNLIKNALYYFEQKPQASLVLTVDDSKVSVRDTGPGIAPEVLAHLFESFMTSGKAEGTGLGLSYCKRTMQDFGGDIRCDSVEGEFTQFTLSFPALSEADLQACKLAEVKQVAASLQPQAAAPALVCNGLEGKTVILAEDDELHRTMLSDFLQDWGMTVLEAQGGNQVLAHLQDTPGVDLILMDMNMPGLDGLQTTQAIRSREWAHQRVCILALTGNSDESDIKAAMTAGVNDLVVKSGDMKFLRKKMAEIFLAAEEGRKLPAS